MTIDRLIAVCQDRVRMFSVAVGLVVGLSLAVGSPALGQDRYPGEHWGKASVPEALGWSSDKLQVALDYADSIGSAAVMVVVDGLVLAEQGETARRFRAHSMRKSLVSALLGVYVGTGDIDIDATLDDLGIETGTPLTRGEGRATVRNLLQGRSGVYVPALYLGGSLDLPPRGSREPGTYFHYANFDFNTLGTIFEQETGKKLFEEFKARIADPIQMEDFRVEDGTYWYGNHDDNVNTRLFAYPFRITARDLARFGLLLLREGRWGDRQIIPAEWVAQVFTPYSDFAESTSYGFTNWKVHLKGKILPNGYKLPDEVYWASGINVHRVYVAPFADLVFVHRINSDIPLRRPSSEQVDRLFGLILDAKLEDLDRALLEATAAGDVAAVSGLLDGGAAVNAKDAQGRNALHLAAGRWGTTIARELLAHGADVNARSDLGETPIMRPAWNGDTLTVRVLLGADAVVDAKDEFLGWTALMLAAARGNGAVVSDLLEAGAEVNARGAYFGETALALGAASGDAETVGTLLGAGADVSAACRNGVTPIMIAEALSHDQVVDLLSAAGASRAAMLLPLSAYLPPGLVASARGGNIWSPPAAHALVSRGATVTADGQSALLVAALRGDVEAVQAMLGAGADVNLPHAHGWTALVLAAVGGHTAVVRALLGAGADVDASEDWMGQSALIWASKAGHEETVAALLGAGAEVDFRDKYGGTALSLAAAEGHATVVDALLAAGADPNVVLNDGSSPLAAAVSDGDAATIRALLEGGADVNGTVVDDWTVLMIGAETGRAGVVRLLLDGGADVDARDAFGETALSIAMKLDRAEVVDLLRERGATE